MELCWPVVIMGVIVSGLVFVFVARGAKKWPKVQAVISAITLFTCGYFLRTAPDELGEFLHPFGDALMVVAVIGVVLEVPHIGKFFQEGLREALTPKIDLEGEWTYEFKNEDRLISQGTCIIEQLGDDVNIYGRRKNQRGQEVDIPWSTQFGVISGTTPPRQYFPKLHFVYEIEVNSQQIEGYCSISLPKKKSISEMDGDVFQLAPNRDFGRMHFEKSSPG